MLISAQSAEAKNCRKIYEEGWLAIKGVPVDDPRWCGEGCTPTYTRDEIFGHPDRIGDFMGCETVLRDKGDLPLTETAKKRKAEMASSSPQPQTLTRTPQQIKSAALRGRVTTDIPDYADSEMLYGSWSPRICNRASDYIGQEISKRSYYNRPVDSRRRQWRSNWLGLNERNTVVCDAIPSDIVAELEARDERWRQNAQDRPTGGKSSDDLRREFWSGLNQSINSLQACEARHGVGNCEFRKD